MTKQKWHKLMAQTHKWIGLILGLQLLAWTIGGLVMTWLPIDEVRGMHKVQEQPAPHLSPDLEYLDVKTLHGLVGKAISSLQYTELLDLPVAKITLTGGGTEIRDAQTGTLLTPISEELAQQIAEADFNLTAAVESVISLNETTTDYRGPLPVWQVNFSDEEKTSLYVSPTRARIVARRSETWRFFDFFWMLHIMDYDERSDINNPLVIATSLFAVLFALSGFALIFFRFYRRDFNFILGKRKRQAS